MRAATFKLPQSTSTHSVQPAVIAQTLELPEANHVLKTSPADLQGNLRAVQIIRRRPLDPALMPPLVAFIRSIAR